MAIAPSAGWIEKFKKAEMALLFVLWAAVGVLQMKRIRFGLFTPYGADVFLPACCTSAPERIGPCCDLCGICIHERLLVALIRVLPQRAAGLRRTRSAVSLAATRESTHSTLLPGKKRPDNWQERNMRRFRFACEGFSASVNPGG